MMFGPVPDVVDRCLLGVGQWFAVLCCVGVSTTPTKSAVASEQSGYTVLSVPDDFPGTPARGAARSGGAKVLVSGELSPRAGRAILPRS